MDVLVLLGMGAAAHAGVWVRDGGEVYLQASVQHAVAERQYDPQGVLLNQADDAFLGAYGGLFDAGRTAVSDLVTYGEVGLGRGFELVGTVPLRIATNRWEFAAGQSPDIRHEHVGLGDAGLGARFGTTVRSSAVSVLAAVRVPLYDNAPEALRTEAGNSDFYDDRVPLGNGTIDLDLSAGAGTSWAWGWALVEAGGRIRNRQYSAALPGRLQVGLRPDPKVGVWLGAEGVQSLGNGEAPDFYVDPWDKGPTIVDNQSFVSATGGASVDATERVGLYASASRVLAARSYPLLTSVTAGVIVRFAVADRPEPVR